MKILIIDDNEPSAQTLVWMMELIGHEAKLALGGSQGIETAEEFLPDVILLDIGMPGMNGYEVCTLMRQQPHLKNCVFIAQTGWGQVEHRNLSKAAGFDYHLVKPIKMEQLEEIIHSIAKNHCGKGEAGATETPR